MIMEVQNVCFSYNKQNNLLHMISTTIKPGKITTIIGPNGSGKSTLLSVMSKLYSPSSGEVILDGKSLHACKPKEVAKRIAVVYQQNEVPHDLTVEKLVHYGRLPYKGLLTYGKGKESNQSIVEWAMRCANLSNKKDVLVSSLSGGERQRVWIAMALAQKTDLLFLDEPTTYLDMFHQIELLELVQKLNREYKMTIVMVLHDLNQAIRYSDQLIVMKDGEIIQEGPPREIITERLVKNIYNVDVALKDCEYYGRYMVPVGI